MNAHSAWVKPVVLKLGGGAQNVLKGGVRDDKLLSAFVVKSYNCYRKRPSFSENDFIGGRIAFLRSKRPFLFYLIHLLFLEIFNAGARINALQRDFCFRDGA